MAPTIPLAVAIYKNPGIKHWSLFIDAENKDDKTILHLIGARQNYHFVEKERSDARTSNSLIELIDLCKIDMTKIETVKDIARGTPILNKERDYSCQDFILEVLDRLEAESIITKSGDYLSKKATLKEKRESWQ